MKSWGGAKLQRGSVMVMVAVWLPVIIMFGAFAVDVAHWFDYSRNLQNRADAAALAAGKNLSACLGTPTQAQTDAIGELGQQYSGPLPSTPDANLPYTASQMATDGFTPYYNQPNLTLGSGANYHVLLNSTAYWPDGGTNWSMGTYCNATDPSDPSVCPAATNPNGCPIVDVRVTQAALPMFIPIFGFHPNISAHARVQLLGIGAENGTGPLAVPDPAQTPCTTARIVDMSNKLAGPNHDGVIAWTSLTRVQGSTPPTWVTGNNPVPLPATSSGDQLSLQVLFPDDCTAPDGAGDTYDAGSFKSGQGGGIAFINTYAPLPATFPAGQTTPLVGSVWLEARGCTDPAESTGQDPYFYFFRTSTSCTVRVHAQADFPAGASTNGLVAQMDGSAAPTSACVPPASGQSACMTSDGVVNGHQEWHADFNISPQSGRHTFVLSWFMSTSGQCANASKAGSNNCVFNGGDPLQETYSGFDDTSATPDDSGAIITAQIGCDASSVCPTIGGSGTSGATSGVDSIPQSGSGSNPSLSITIQLQGFQESRQKDPAIILRASVQDSKRTGAFDCGQGSGGSLGSVIINGCPHTLTLYDGSTCVVLPSVSPLPANSRYANGTEAISCVAPVTGNKRMIVNNAISTRICGSSSCSATPSGKACDYWMAYKLGNGTTPPKPTDPSDPRAIPLAVTSPAALATGISNSAGLIPILNFATFYVTGWDGDPYLPGGSAIPGCTGTANSAHDEKYPYGTTPSNAVWGHFVQYSQSGIPNPNQTCQIGIFGDCTSALTR